MKKELLKKAFLFRIRIVSVGIVMVGLFLIARLYFIQISESEKYIALAARNNTSRVGSFDRGTIYFERKDGSLITAATVMDSFILAIEPINIQDKEAVYEKLNSVVSIDREDFMQKAGKEDDPYEEITQRLTREERNQIVAFNLPGVVTSSHRFRFYPGERLASHTIGFMSYKGDELRGQYGVERFYNDILSRDREEVKINIFAELFSSSKNTLLVNPKVSKANIFLTIEPVVQNFLEQELLRTINRFGSESASGIVINPQNGQILAMAHVPDFDLNNFRFVRNSLVYVNPLVENVFEFGSVVKPLVIAAGLDAGVISADTPFYDAGFIQVEDKRIENFDKKGRGQTTIQAVLSDSLNTGMVYTMRQIGRNRFRDYMLSYGIGERTGIDLPNESIGLVSNLREPRELEYATASFGQGISFSPMALVRALSAMVNGGYLIQPHVVKRIEYVGEEVKEITYNKKDFKKILQDDTSEKIARMMVHTVDHTLAGGRHKMPGHSIAGKTGTAQIPNPSGRGYIEGKNMHSFVGFLPAYEPEFLIFISNTAPVGARFASETLTEPFMNISRFLINYYEIPPDR